MSTVARLPRAANIGVGDTVADEMRPLVGPGKRDGVPAEPRHLERQGVRREGEPGGLDSTFTDEADRDAFILSLPWPPKAKYSDHSCLLSLLRRPPQGWPNCAGASKRSRSSMRLGIVDEAVEDGVEQQDFTSPCPGIAIDSEASQDRGRQRVM
jgi:hypothetical protein